MFLGADRASALFSISREDGRVGGGFREEEEDDGEEARAQRIDRHWAHVRRLHTARKAKAAR